MLDKSDFDAHSDEVYKQGFEAGVTAAVEVMQIEFGSQKAKKIFTRMLKSIEREVVNKKGDN